MTVAANIVASDVTCTNEQELELGQALLALEELIARAEALLAYLQIALEEATGTTPETTTMTTTAAMTTTTTTTTTTTPYPGYCPSCPLGSVCEGICDIEGTCTGVCTAPELEVKGIK